MAIRSSILEIQGNKVIVVGRWGGTFVCVLGREILEEPVVLEDEGANSELSVDIGGKDE